MSDTVLSGEYHADVTELASQIRELQAENERLNNKINGLNFKIDAQQSISDDAISQSESLLAENERLTNLVSHISTEHEACQLKLEQYESTPERGLGSILRGHFDLGGVTRTIQLFDREGRLVNNISLTAEDIG